MQTTKSAGLAIMHYLKFDIPLIEQDKVYKRFHAFYKTIKILQTFLHLPIISFPLWKQ